MAKKTGKKPIDNKKFRKVVKDAVVDYQYAMDTNPYVVDVAWMEEDETEREGKTHSNYTLASIHVYRRYLKATVKIYPILAEEYKKHGVERVKECIAHEMAHLATQHLYDVAVAAYRDEGEMSDAWETLTEIIGRMAYKIRAKK